MLREMIHFTELVMEKLRGRRHHLGDTVVDGGIILKQILKNRV